MTEVKAQVFEKVVDNREYISGIEAKEGCTEGQCFCLTETEETGSVLVPCLHLVSLHEKDEVYTVTCGFTGDEYNV